MLGFVALTLTGFTSCAELGSYALAHPVIRGLPQEQHVEVEKGLLKIFGARDDRAHDGVRDLINLLRIKSQRNNSNGTDYSLSGSDVVCCRLSFDHHF